MAKNGSKKETIKAEFSGDGISGALDTLNKMADSISILGARKPFEILEAHIKDDFCHYVLDVTDGPMIGKTGKISGPLIIDKDLREAFAKFNVHLAVIDDVFKHADIQIGNIDLRHGDELATLYTVTGFKMSGAEENEGVILIGSKFVSGGGRINLVSPKIMIDENSSYKWKNELREAVRTARREVELYENGKGARVEPEEEKPDPKQTKLKFEKPAGETEETAAPDVTPDPDFENAMV